MREANPSVAGFRSPEAVIRPVRRPDLPALKAIIAATDLFPAEMLDEMTAGYFSDATDAARGDEFWLAWDDGEPRAVAYYAPERLTAGTWNLYLIAVHPDLQGRGVGSALLKHMEQSLAARGERLLLVETSGLPDFERTRAFYLKCGYEKEATIRDFYDAGDDKIVFRKKLA
jgi:ribosomal protein S18 acetylase RimI-like enzyme